MAEPVVRKWATNSMENPFKIDIAENKPMKAWDLVLQVGGLKTEKQAKQFADALSDWLIEESGWKSRVQ